MSVRLEPGNDPHPLLEKFIPEAEMGSDGGRETLGVTRI
jgi:hypothetical protein